MTHFQYVNAPCGAGKTTSLINFYKERIARTDSRLVIAQPTIELMRATAERFKQELGVEATLVFAQSRSEPAAPHFKAALEDKNIKLILVTHATLIANPHFAKANSENTYLIIDEIPSIEEARDVQLNTFKDILAANFDVVPSDVSSYYRLVRNQDSSKFDIIRTDNNDQVVKSFEEIFEAVNSDHRDAFVTTDAWAKFIDPDLKSYQLTVHLILLPTLFDRWKNVIIMGANFTDSMLYKAWSTFDNVTFSEWDHSKDLPSIHSEDTGARATIYYCIDQIWSKSIEEKHGILSIVSGEIAEHFGDRPFIYAINNSTATNSIAPLSMTGIEAPVISHGINAYRHIHNAVFTAALNDTPKHLSFISEYFGIEKGVISESKSFETAYQFVMRTSLRMPGDTAPVEIVVMDKRTAEFLASKLPGSTVRMLGNIELPEKLTEQPLRALTGAERIAKKRKIEKRVKAVTAALVPSHGMITYTRWNSVDNKVAAREDHTVTFDDFADRMEARSKETLTSKFNGWLMNGSGVRKAAEAFTTNLLMFDIDKTDIQPTEISNIIDCAHIVANSFSNNESEVRYRVIVPLTHSCEDAVARFVGEMIVGKIVAYAGSRKPGIDRVTPVGVYLEPTRPASGMESDHVFIKNNWSVDSVLNPSDFVSDLVKAEIDEELDEARRLETAVQHPSLSADDIDAKAAVALERHASTSAGTGNSAFNKFAWSMAGMGIPMDRIETYLFANAAFFGSNRQDRIKQIPNIMKNIRSGRVVVKQTPPLAPEVTLEPLEQKSIIDLMKVLKSGTR